MSISKKIYNKIFVHREASQKQNVIAKWIADGKPSPPPHIIKQLAIEEEKQKSKYNTLIETGTYLGEMVEAQKLNFSKVYSIELGRELFLNAVKRFKDDKNVVIMNGDSGVILNELMAEINEPAIFWLDGHYSEGITAKGEKECPILEELTAIFAYKKINHIILIDDARLFNGTNDYPNIEDLKAFIKTKIQDFTFTINNDIIRVAELYQKRC